MTSEESVDVPGDLRTETEGERGKMDLLELSSVLTASNVVEEEVRAFGEGGNCGTQDMV